MSTETLDCVGLQDSHLSLLTPPPTGFPSFPSSLSRMSKRLLRGEGGLCSLFKVEGLAWELEKVVLSTSGGPLWIWRLFASLLSPAPPVFAGLAWLSCSAHRRNRFPSPAPQRLAQCLIRFARKTIRVKQWPEKGVPRSQISIKSILANSQYLYSSKVCRKPKSNSSTPCPDSNLVDVSES